MLIERLSELQFYELMTAILALGFAGLLAVILWPLRAESVDRGGFQ
jgi:hypothetical protein